MSLSSLPDEFKFIFSKLSPLQREKIQQTYTTSITDSQTEFDAYSKALYKILIDEGVKDDILQYLGIKMWFINGNHPWILDIGSDLTHPAARAFYALALLFKGDSKEAISILERLKSREPYFQMEILGIRSFSQCVVRRYQEVEKTFKEAFKLRSQPFFKKSQAFVDDGYIWVLSRYAYTVRASGDFERALELIEQAYNLSLQGNNRFLQILSLIIFGQCLENIGQLSNALEKYDIALDLSQEIGARSLRSMIFNRIGLALSGLGKFDDAYEFFQKAYDSAIDIGSDWLSIGPLGNLSGFKRSKGNLWGAIEDLEQVREFSESFGDKKDLFHAYMALSDLYREVGQKKKSQDNFWKGLLLGINLGFFYVELGTESRDRD
ncbi:MAG: tetratricopeptide repeat protein [Candidatus Hodarchaeota archaeon]